MRGSAALIAGALVVAAAAPALADPCTVDMVRVPDDVRPVIEKWVAAEPSCRIHLAVRVLATDGGYYVLATDPAGGVRERLVPDATTAAVLIASWVADDGGTTATATPSPTPTPTPAPTPAPTPMPDAAAVTPTPVTPVFAQHNPPVTPVWAQASPPVTPAWAQSSPPVRPPWATTGAGPSATPPAGPGAIAPVAQVDTGVTAKPRKSDFHRLIAFGLTMAGHGTGWRGEADITSLWRIRIVAIAAVAHTEYPPHYADLSLDDVVLAAAAGNELHWGRIDVRTTIGGGIARTTGSHMSSLQSSSSASPFFDTAFTAGLRLTHHVEVRAGLDIELLPQRINNGQFYWDRGFIFQSFLGLGYRGD
jgi:hypothetical protein